MNWSRMLVLFRFEVAIHGIAAPIFPFSQVNDLRPSLKRERSITDVSNERARYKRNMSSQVLQCAHTCFCRWSNFEDTAISSCPHSYEEWEQNQSWRVQRMA